MSRIIDYWLKRGGLFLLSLNSCLTFHSAGWPKSTSLPLAGSSIINESFHTKQLEQPHCHCLILREVVPRSLVVDALNFGNNCARCHSCWLKAANLCFWSSARQASSFHFRMTPSAFNQLWHATGRLLLLLCYITPRKLALADKVIMWLGVLSVCSLHNWLLIVAGSFSFPCLKILRLDP